jgi:mono/diheme cytochrome c family protein
MAASGQAKSAHVLLRSQANVPLLREAFVSGLGKEAYALLRDHGPFEDSALETLLVQSHPPETTAPTEIAALEGPQLAAFLRGKIVYDNSAACMGCHGPQGLGLDNLGPPLAGSEWVTGDPKRLTRLLLHGMTGPVTVSGILYNPPLDMPGIGVNPSIKDGDIADLLVFLRNSWGQRLPSPCAEEVTQIRKKYSDRFLPYKEAELR